MLVCDNSLRDLTLGKSMNGDKPDFICVGMQKGGTRWLFDQLEFHPDFWMPPLKELRYFEKERPLLLAQRLKKRARAKLSGKSNVLTSRRDFSEADIEWLEKYIEIIRDSKVNFNFYSSLFDTAGTKLSGDISPGYSQFSRQKAQKIREQFPTAKILLLVRDPVSRTWSQYCMAARKFNWPDPESTHTLQRFLEKPSWRLLSDLPKIVENWKIDENDSVFKLFWFDDIVTRPETTISDIIDFVGGDGNKKPTIAANYNRKTTLRKVPMTPEAHEILVSALGSILEKSAASFGGWAKEWRTLRRN